MKEAIEKFLNAVRDDMASQNAKVPEMRVEATQIEGKLFAPDWFQYMIYGRGPGKQPPPDKLIAWVNRNPSMLADARNKWKYITSSGLAYLIGRKIGQSGTRIWRGEAKGVDFLGAIERNLPELKKDFTKEQSENIKTSLVNALKKV
jgi:hypothetical protein